MMPTFSAKWLLSLVAAVLLLLSLRDYFKQGRRFSIAGKTWLRIALIYIFVVLYLWMLL